MVEWDGLENRCTASRYRGFESHPLRRRVGGLASTCCLLLLTICSLASTGAHAQTLYGVVHRPSHVRYDVLKTEHFDLIFQRGLDTLVFEAASTLEEAYDNVRSETGFDREFRMPVVLNDYSDISNGFVTAAPFRQEISAAPIKGKVLSPRHSDWLHQVLPHEMVHAAQAESRWGFGIGAILGIFSRDLERALNLGIPAGMTEGLAVLHESSEEGGYGRLNFSMTMMQYRAAAASNKPWSLGQLIDPPAFTRPFDRYYTGGGFLTKFLEDSVKTDFFNRTLAFYNRMPLLGYGTALWIGAGKAPWKLSNSFQRHAVRSERHRLAALGDLTEMKVLTAKMGRACRRPKWIDRTTLLTYCSGYDETPGFYRIQTDEKVLRYAYRQSIIEDRFYSVGADGRSIVFPRYKPALTVPTASHSGLHLLDLKTGRSSMVSSSERFYGPVQLGDGAILALRDEGQFNAIWRFPSSGPPERLFGEFGTVIREIAVGRDGKLVVLANRSGEQAVYTFERVQRGWRLIPAVAVRKGSIYDPIVTPDGRWIVFAADPDGVQNLYAYSTSSRSVHTLTNVRFGAFEPAISPDGSQLAFVHYVHEQYQLALMEFDPSGASVASGFGLPLERPRTIQNPDAGVRDSLAATVRPYSPFPDILMPRAVAPFILFREEALDPLATELWLGLGATLFGADPVQQWSYSVGGFYEADRPWGRATVQTGMNALRPFVRLLNEPLSRNLALDDSTVVEVRREERSAEVGVVLPLMFSRNVHTTQLNLRLAAEYRALRLINEDSSPLDDFNHRFTLTPSAVFGYRLQSNIRDFIPNSGVLIASAAEIDAHADNDVAPSRASRTDVSWFLPLMKSQNRGIRLIGGLLWQNRGSVVNTDTFLPRGYEDDVVLEEGTFLKAGLEIVQPLFYLDRGLVLIPIALEGMYVYGFGESVLSWTDLNPLHSSAGIGLGARLRLFHGLRVDARIAVSRLLEEDRWAISYR